MTSKRALMDIAILGPGCPKCRQTVEVVPQAVEQEAPVSGAMSLPGVGSTGVDWNRINERFDGRF